MTEDHIFEYKNEFKLESGSSLPAFQLYYTTYGTLNERKDNVIWVIHAFSGSSDFTQWWSGIFGEGRLYDPRTHFVICANILGGCYGSTGPLSLNPKTGRKYYHDFPLVTNRDSVRAFDLLRQNLGIERIHTVIGCSQGGQQAIEWAIESPEVFEHLVAIGANARHSPWGVAFNESQRMAIEQDPTWKESRDDAGLEGMKTARSIALLSYRNHIQYNKTQAESSDEVYDDYKASSYQRYQGLKMSKRFNAFTYWYVSKAMDSQNVGRGRGGLKQALGRIRARSLFVGIGTDILFPTEEQKFLAANVKGGEYVEIESDYGHDGFLLEFEKLTTVINGFYSEKSLGIAAY